MVEGLFFYATLMNKWFPGGQSKTCGHGDVITIIEVCREVVARLYFCVTKIWSAILGHCNYDYISVQRDLCL